MDSYRKKTSADFDVVMPDDVTTERINELILAYYKGPLDARHQRLGQYICNKLNITASRVFYATRDGVAIGKLFKLLEERDLENGRQNVT